jgi:outer membrane murein-binding lipoprotein Lpp
MKRITIGFVLCAALFLAAGCSSQQSANQHSANRENAKMEKTENKTENTIFRRAKKQGRKLLRERFMFSRSPLKTKTIIFQSPASRSSRARGHSGTTIRLDKPYS